MKRPTIEVVIDLEGNVEVEGKEFKGSFCDTAMSWIEGLLGKVTKRLRTGGKPKEKNVLNNV